MTLCQDSSSDQYRAGEYNIPAKSHVTPLVTSMETATVYRTLRELSAKCALIKKDSIPHPLTPEDISAAFFEKQLEVKQIFSDRSSYYLLFTSADAATRARKVGGSIEVKAVKRELSYTIIDVPTQGDVDKASHSSPTRPKVQKPETSPFKVIPDSIHYANASQKEAWSKSEAVFEGAACSRSMMCDSFISDVTSRSWKHGFKQEIDARQGDQTQSIPRALSEQTKRPSVASVKQRLLGKKVTAFNQSRRAAPSDESRALRQPTHGRATFFADSDTDSGASDQASNEPDLRSLRLVHDDEDYYYLKMVFDKLDEKRAANGILEVEESDFPKMDLDQEEEAEIHDSGSARTEGFFKFHPLKKASHVPDRNKADDEAPTVPTFSSARENRADSRRLVAHLEQHKRESAFETDILKINQLRTRKKQLRFAKSPIHDWGLYAVEGIPRGDMIIEYVGEVIRQQVADEREKANERGGNFSTYLFRVDEDVVIDATRKGNIARLMNVSIGNSGDRSYLSALKIRTALLRSELHR